MNGNTQTVTKTRRTVYVMLGATCVALGAVGIVVPGLPTTCFLLAASWLFARSSPALERRLLAHPTFGRYLRLAQGRAMPLRAKVVTVLFIWGGSLGACTVLSPPLQLLMVALAAAGTAAVLFWVRTISAAAVPVR